MGYQEEQGYVLRKKKVQKYIEVGLGPFQKESFESKTFSVVKSLLWN